MIFVPIKMGNLDTEASTQGECHVKTVIMLPQAKELPSIRRKDLECILPWHFLRESGPSDTLISDF